MALSFDAAIPPTRRARSRLEALDRAGYRTCLTLGMANSEVVSPSPTAARLREQSENIQQQWLQRIVRELAAAREQAEPALRDNIPKIIDALAVELEQAGAEPRRRELFTRHAEARIDWSNYSAEELMREYGLLRKVLFAVLEERGPLPQEQRDWILDFIDEGVQVGASRFTEAKRLNDRVELRYLKLIERLVVETGGDAGLEVRIERLLDVIATDLGAETAAFFLQDDETLEVTLSAATSQGRPLADLYRGALALAVAREARNEHDDAVQLLDVAGLAREEGQSLNALGVSWLVLVRVVARGRVPGTLCLGFRERRALDPAERRLLEALADRLALLIASLQLHEQSRAALERARRQADMIEAERNGLDEERRRRDELIAAISHDLKNPLHTAKMGAELIRSGAGAPGATERLADQILKSISRSDQMIVDLLDSQRIRAGKRLQVDIVQYRMNDLVAEVVSDLTSLYGDRFRVRADGQVEGFWSWAAMRRALENLLSNAVKYSTPGSPITISVRAADGPKMHLSVHNEGPPLSPEEQTRIFRPFERGRSAEHREKRGWGIGLTLVRGIVDAHGGTIQVESTGAGGTTFTIINPMDSRPYQRDA
jgi:signal transduction histidine kinase